MAAGELAAYQQVPDMVRKLYKSAANIQKRVAAVVKHLKSADPGYGQVWWNDATQELWVSLSDSDTENDHQKWHTSLRSVPGVQHVRTVAEAGPPDKKNWVRVKGASAFRWLNKPFEWGGEVTGGPTPLSNAVVGALLGGAGGYGLGTVAEQLLPERWFERGRLRKTLGLFGAGLGTVPAIKDWALNQSISADAGKPVGPAGALITPDDQLPIHPDEGAWHNNLEAGRQQRQKLGEFQDAVKALPEGTPLPHPLFLKAAQGFSTGAAGIDMRPVPVDAFNQAIWNDVHNGVQSARNNPYGTKSVWGDNTQELHTPPAVGAAATGLVSGIQSMYGGASLLSPRHFVNGLLAAGIDTATATVAGGVLGALGGLRPEAQQSLQRAGVWSGLIRGVTGSVLGLY